MIIIRIKDSFEKKDCLFVYFLFHKKLKNIDIKIFL